MNILSLFSGVGGFDLGLEAAGHRTIYQCDGTSGGIVLMTLKEFAELVALIR